MRYNWLSALSVLSAAPLCPLATPLQPHWGSMRVKHAWNAVPPDWEHLGHPAAETTIDLYIALKSQRESALIDALYDVSTPSHIKYGMHLSKEQVADLVAPHPDTLELINSWLEYYGIPSSSVTTSHGGSWLTLTGVPVSRANALLGTSYQLYQHAETKVRVLLLHAHVQTVAPTTYFGSPRARRQTLRKRSGGAAAALAKSESEEPTKVLSIRANEYVVTPGYLHRLYKTFGYVPAAGDRNVLGIAGYLGDYPDHDDLTEFMKRYRPDARYATYEFEHVGDEDLPYEPNEEANVDLQYSEAITGFLIWLNYIIKQPKVPQTISTSYDGEEQYFSEGYATALCDLFAQLGLRGASVIFASGDDAVGRGECRVNDGSGKVQFLPTFPASCPWVTSVGGTIDHSPEVAVAFSSGGFSNYFKRPRYQDYAVSIYLQHLGNQYRGLYKWVSLAPMVRSDFVPYFFVICTALRAAAFPTFAAQAYNFAFIFNGEPDTFWGTSCSAPTVAGVISLLNDYQLSKGRPPLGWLNPFLYSFGRAGLNDITFGSNPGCKTRGFSAIEGWDPITGLGTPDFRELLGILDGLW
ncbi:subtilisin-like protein [Lactarius psammicola]|nr:subtilisin-like protein [Lactarius psammicola]